jgi:AcrR family transcriptional regulator
VTPTKKSFLPERYRRPLPRGRHSLPPQLVHQLQRRRLFIALATVTATKGYATTIVEDIVREAHVSRRTFYDHFPDGKEACFLEGFQEIFSYVFNEISRAADQEIAWGDRFRMGLTRLVEMLIAERELARLCVVDVMAAGPEAVRRRDAGIEQFVGLLNRGLENAAEGMEPPVLTPECVLSGIYGVLYARIEGNRFDELPGVLPELVYFSLAPFLGFEAAREQMELARGAL